MSDLTLVLFLNQFFTAAETDKQAQNFDERPYRERRPQTAYSPGGDAGRQLICGSLDQPESTSQTASVSVYSFF